MSVNRLVLGSLVLTLAGACTAFRFLQEPAVAPGTTKIEFENPRIEGKYLVGRVLVGAVGGPVTLDHRLTPHANVQVVDVMDCVTQAPIDFLMWDAVTPEPRDTERITVGEGYWYGADLRLLVYDEALIGKPSPDCILAKVVVVLDPSRTEAQGAYSAIVVRAERIHPAPVEPPPPAQGVDAGSPEAQEQAAEPAGT